MEFKEFIIIALFLMILSGIGFSWSSGYNNRVQINISSQTTNYTGVAFPITLNSTILGSDACQETMHCNDSLVTYLNDTPIYFYIEYYNASDNWRLFVNASIIHTDSNFSIYFYYNNSVLTRSTYYNGNKVFLRFNDFENYTNNTRVSADFGVFSLPADEPRSLTDCYKGENCIFQTTGDGIVYGFLTHSYEKGILEYRYLISGGDHYDATFYVRAGMNGTDEGAITSFGGVYLTATWTKIKIKWDSVSTLFNVTWGNLNGIKSVANNVNFSQYAFPLYSSAIMPLYLDNYFVRQLVEETLIDTFSSIENAPPLIANFTIVTQVFPVNATTNTTNDILLGYFVNASDTTISCSLLVNGTLSQTNTSALNGSLNTFPLNALGNETYVWSVNCTIPGLTNETGNWTFTIAKAYPVTPPEAGGKCEISAENEIQKSSQFFISVTPSTPDDIVRYSIYDQYENVFFSSDNSTGKALYIFQQHAPNKLGAYTILAKCNSTSAIKTIKVVNVVTSVGITGTSLMNTGFPLKLFLYMIGVAACIIVGSRIRIPIVWFLLAVLILYIGFTFFL